MMLTLVTSGMSSSATNRRANDRNIARTKNLISLCLGVELRVGGWGLGLEGDTFYAKLKSILDSNND